MKPFQEEPEAQSSFVLNLENHWFTFRRFGGRQDCWLVSRLGDDSFRLIAFLQMFWKLERS